MTDQTQNKDQPDYISTAVASMLAESDVCRALCGGTRAMRNAGETYLPKWPQEDKAAWEARCKSSVLFPALKKAIGVMVGKPLGSPIGVGDDVPASIEIHLDDIDRDGRNLDNFARSVAVASLRDGITWVLADHTPVPEGATLATERELGARPYLIHIPLSNMLGWRFEGGQLVQLRYRETVEEPSGKFASTTKTRIREWVKEGAQILVRVWEKAAESGTWMSSEIPTKNLKAIPIVPIYGERVGSWAAEPPLVDMAWLNAKHWRCNSDMDVTLHYVCVPILAAEEDTRSDPEADVALKSNGLLVGFKGLQYVEHTGSGIGAARQNIIDLEEQMRRVAGELLSRTVQKTATEADLESSEGESWLRAWARNFEDALMTCLNLMAAWVGEKSGGTLSLDFDWDDSTLASDMLTALTNARTAGEISRETYLTALKDGKILPAGRTIEQEIEALDKEGPAAFKVPETP